MPTKNSLRTLTGAHEATPTFTQSSFIQRDTYTRPGIYDNIKLNFVLVPDPPFHHQIQFKHHDNTGRKEKCILARHKASKPPGAGKRCNKAGDRDAATQGIAEPAQ